MSSSASRSFLSFFVFTLAVTCYRVYILSLQQFDLYADESQYWTWAQSFEWGYYSKPPMVAWLIMLTENYCGDTSFCIRLSSPILHALTGFLVYLIGKQLFDHRTGLWSGITYLTLPAVSLSSILISTDPALLFFWALAFLFFLYALDGWKDRWWLYLGIAVGFGMLSKYTMIFFFVSVFLYLLYSITDRLLLRSAKLWISVLMAVTIYAPNLLWNYANGFVSYLHTKDNANINALTLHPKELMEFVVSQFGVFGPILFAVLLFLMGKTLQLLREGRPGMLLLFVWPFFATIAAISLLSRANANWAAPIYVTATVLVVAWLIEHRKRWLLYTSLTLHLLIAGVMYNYDALASRFDIPLSAKTDPFKRLRGMSAMSGEVAAYLEQYPGTVPASDERKVVATLMYYLRRPEGAYPVMKWNADRVIQDHYDLTADINLRPGQDFLFITRAPTIDNIIPYFKSTQKVGAIHIPFYADYTLHYDIYLMKKFKGY